MSTGRRKSKGHNPEVVNVGCRGWRLNLRFVLPPSPKPKLLKTKSGPSSSRYGDFASDLYRPERDRSKIEFEKSGSAGLAARMGIDERSVAVVKESSDPYQDFGDSMLQMILEMEICAWVDLCDLLRRFLALNAPRHHCVILSVFAEVCGLIFSTPCRLRARPSNSKDRGGCSKVEIQTPLHARGGRSRNAELPLLMAQRN